MYALACTFGVFCLIVVLSRVRVPLMLSILVGAVAEAALLMGASWTALGTLAEGLVLPDTVGLILITGMQLVLASSMQEGGQMDRLVSLAMRFFRRPAIAMIALPAMIGLLPMPGGALVSAPMVGSAAGEHSVEPARLSAINYWFRHIWEHWWPLYPGVMMAMDVTHSTFLEFARTQWPLCVVMVLSGLLIFRGASAGLHATLPKAPPGTKRKLLWAASSIWVIILLWAAAEPLVRAANLASLPRSVGEAIKRFGPIFVGLCGAVLWTARLNRTSWRRMGRLVIGRPVQVVAGLVISVMVFKHVIDATGAAVEIGEGLRRLNIPVVAVVAVLPFIAGAVTGLAFGFVGTSFPIVLPLAALLAGSWSTWPYVALAYAFGHMGQMISPLHLCQVVSNRYFNTSFGPVYKHFVPSWCLAGVGSVAYVLFLWWVMR